MKSQRLDHMLPGLSTAERTWLAAVLEIAKGGPVALSEVWTKTWFTSVSQRALIVQPPQACAYLYFAGETSVQPEISSQVVREFLENAMLLELLRRDGIAFISDAPASRPTEIQCIGQIFEQPRVDTTHGRRRITLNRAGDYTEEPGVIRNADGTAVYHSVRLAEDVFDLLRCCTHGVLYIRESECERIGMSLAAIDLIGQRESRAAETCAAQPAPTHCLKGNRSAITAKHRRPNLFRRMKTAARESLLHFIIVGSVSAAHGAVAGWYAKDFVRQKQAATQSKMAANVAAPATGQQADARLACPGRLASAASGTSSRGCNAWSGPVAVESASGRAPPPAAAAAAAAAAATSAPAASASSEAQPSVAPIAAASGAPASNQTPSAAAALGRLDGMHDRPHGIDVSRWSGDGRTGAGDVFAAVPKADFAFARVAYGISIDPEFSTNWAIMGSRRIYRGAYLFLRMDQDPIEQVDRAVKALGARGRKDLCLAIDFEELSFETRAPAPSVAEVQRTLASALNEASVQLGCLPMLYTNPDVGNRYLNSPAFARYPLWVADWSKSAQPKLPSAWSNFSFWQRADHLTATPDPADLDVFNGRRIDLNRFIRDSTGTPPLPAGATPQ